MVTCLCLGSERVPSCSTPKWSLTSFKSRLYTECVPRQLVRQPGSEAMTVISVIVGSTRRGRFSEKPAEWILQQLKKRDGVDARLLDLRDYPMPFFDQPATPAIPGRPPFEHKVVQK